MSKASRRYLEQHGSKWRVVVPVPRPLQKAVGATKLKRHLHTDSLATANHLKWRVVQELQREIARRAHGHPEDSLTTEAMALRDEYARERDDFQREVIADQIYRRGEEIAGKASEVVDERTGEQTLRYEPAKEAHAEGFVKLALGLSTPLRSYLTQWHGQSVRSLRVMKDDERALDLLEGWCRAANVNPAIESLSRKNAGLFVSSLCDEAALARGSGRLGRTNSTINKYISSLSAYWRWLKQRGHVEQNVWDGQGLQKAKRTDEGERERPFRDDEVVRLLNGETKPYLHALMRIAALTGARIDAIASLKVSDCRDGIFRFKPQKREKNARQVPIHTTLKPIIERLCADKNVADHLFPELPPVPEGSERERSMPGVKLFNRYRRSLGVDEVVPGKRRSLVNFHSFRRWFVTKAEQAGQPPWTIASVVGHRRQGMTLGVYSAGPAEEQLRACVEAVRLPAAVKR